MEWHVRVMSYISQSMLFPMPLALSSGGSWGGGTMSERDKLTIFIAVLVGSVWAIAALTSLLLEDYTGLSIITPVMLIVAGFLFGSRGRH